MKTGIALISLGGPKSLEEVPDFIKNLTGVDLPERVILGIKERYKLIGGGSPLPEITEKQAKSLEKLLPPDFTCLPAFRYTKPDIGEVIDFFVNNGYEQIFFFILSPFFTSVTTGNYLNFAENFIKTRNIQISYSFIYSWYKNESFINCWVKKIKDESKEDLDYFYLFSAHSLPERLSKEPYKEQIEEFCKIISERLGLKNWALGWQSIPSNAKEPWIGPEVEKVMEDIKSKGFNSILQIPIGFTADHIETLYDIDIIHANYAKSLGLSYKRVSSLNDYPLFIKALFDILLERMDKAL
ncbi:MAG: ferrochelatase [Proteobacteria bacterium]|nr:ferrochelatase [Pseudomonadota bacterium]